MYTGIGGVTCPAITAQDTASKEFRPHPQADGSAATAGSALTRTRFVNREKHEKAR